MRKKFVTGVDYKERKKKSDKAEQDLNRIVRESQPHTFGEKLDAHIKANPDFQKDLANGYIDNINTVLKNNFIGRKVAISIEADMFPLVPSPEYKLITAELSVGTYKIPCAFACGYLHKLKPSSEELRSGKVNILDHLFELVPKQGRPIGLFTYQNGINNSLDDFYKMGNSIIKNIPEKTLCIGLYNPKKGLFNDALGVLDKLAGILFEITCATHECFKDIAEKLSRSNPGVYWAHIAHSEGGLIAETVLELLQEHPKKEYFKNNLLVCTYGAVLPIPTTHAKAINTYSSKDGATYPRVKSYLEGIGEDIKDYKIEIVYPKDFNNQIPHFYGHISVALKLVFDKAVGDHSFQGATYQEALEKNIKAFKIQAKNYDGK